MAKTIFSADDARKLVGSLSSERMEKVENSLVNQIETACEAGDGETIWRSALPPELHKKLEANGYNVTEEEDGFVVWWGALT